MRKHEPGDHEARDRQHRTRFCADGQHPACAGKVWVGDAPCIDGGDCFCRCHEGRR